MLPSRTGHIRGLFFPAPSEGKVGGGELAPLKRGRRRNTLLQIVLCIVLSPSDVFSRPSQTKSSYFADQLKYRSVLSEVVPYPSRRLFHPGSRNSLLFPLLLLVHTSHIPTDSEGRRPLHLN